MAEYVFELLTEEIPAWMHDTAQATIRQLLGKIVKDLGGDEKTPLVNSTPRRISFFLPGLPEREADRDEELKGPPVRAAYDATGAPSPALLGFLKKNNAAIEEVIPGGDYIKVRRIVPGRTIAGVLQEKIPAMIESLRWPKMMRWGNGEHLYIRPVHSVLSLFDGAHLPIVIFGVTSGTTTVGHRTLAPEIIEIQSYNDYVTKLELARVVIDAARRRQVMAERARILATQVHGMPSTDASIWSQWQYLTEYPGVLRAEFRPEYLELPEEVLVTVMRVHQKQLPIRDNAGKLTNSFLAVIDNDADLDGNAAYGNSFVTNARFADARFFHETDRKRPLADRVEQLSHLQFQEKLGNYHEKSRRIEAITEGIASELTLDGAEAVQAARLCKADLVTEMVKEFPDLQGRVGGIYAREEGLPEGVWQTIYDHYLPVNIDDALPRAVSGAIVSIADKIDTLVGFFRVGSRPTGSKDPFALRRAAQGVVQILLNRDQRQIKIGLDRLLDLGLAAHGLSGPDAATQRQDLLTFFAERVRTILEASAYGFAYDEIAAAMEASWASSLTDLVDRITALKAMRNEPNFLSVLDSARRIANIVAAHESTVVDPAKLENDTERRLHGVATLAVEQIEEMIGERDYRRALESFAGLAPELQAFFKEVMVMVDDPAVRANRMSLLRMIGSAVGGIGDVTKIVVDRSEYRP